MSAFITETLSEDLSVLILSQSSSLSDLLATELRKNGLEVTKKSSDLGSLDQFLESNLSSTWYKIFWIDDVESISLEKAKKVVRIFQSVKGLSYVVMHQPFQYLGMKKFEQVGKSLSEVNEFFSQRSPYTSVLTYQDVLSNEFFSLNYQQIVHFLHAGKFPFTQEEFAFLSEEEMIEGIVSLSFDPRGGKRRVVIGKRPWLVRSALKAIQTEFRRRFKGEEVFINSDMTISMSSEFKQFPVVSSLTVETIVSELIVQAKFHYKPPQEKVSQASDIPRPNIPKPSFSLEKKDLEPPRKDIVPDLLKKEVAEEPVPKKKVEESPRATVSEVRKENTIKIPSEKTVSREPDVEMLLKPLIKNASLTPVLKNIQESSIQVRVTAPLATMSRAPVMIPEQPIPEIKRSKIVLSQLSSLEKPIVPQQPFSIPNLNRRVAERVQHEQAVEKVKPVVAEEQKVDEQKKQLEKKIATLFSGTLQPSSSKKQLRKERVSPAQVLFGPQTRVGKWYRTKKKILLFMTAVGMTTSLLVGGFFLNQVWLQRDLLQLVEQFNTRSTIDQKTMGRIQFSQRLLDRQLSVYSTILGTSLFGDVYAQLDMSHKLTSLEADLAEVQKLHTTAVKQILGSEEGNPLQTLTPALTKTENIYKQLSVIEAELKQQEQNSFVANNLTTQQQEELIVSLGEIRREVLVGQQLIEIMPTIFSDQKRKIAVVVQDNSELRATGGFIQSIAILSFEQGHLTDVKMLLPDEVSAALSGVITPPEEITQYLKETQWFVRDAGWNPDFEVTAKQVALFLDKGAGTQVDGVVAVNTASLARLVGVFDSISLSDFADTTVTEKNLSEKNFSFAKETLLQENPDATKVFLNSVFQSMMKKVQDIDEEQANKLMNVISETLEQSETMISLTDPSAETTLSTLGWTGRLMSPPCPAQLVQDQCVVSRIFQVDSNVGVNKVNDVVKKKVEHFVELKPDKIIHKRVIAYENSSTTNSWPGGTYKDYVRWYVPRDVKLRLISVNSKAVEASQIRQYEDKSSLVFGTLIEVLPQTTTRIVLEYEELPLQKQSSFVFFDQKQSGTSHTPTNITFFYDSEYVPTVIAPDATVSDDKIEFSFVGDKHRFAGVKFR